MPTQDVFELVFARPVLAGCGEHAHLTHIQWVARQQGRHVVQVYVDGQLAAVTTGCNDRAIWLHVDRARPRTIELLAVDPDIEDATRAYPAALATWPDMRRTLTVSLLRDELLPLDTQIELRVDGALHVREALWSYRDARGGLGGVLGLGALGVDGSSSPGLGLGMLGVGPCGIDGEAWSACIAAVEPGDHTLTLTATLPSGPSVAPPVDLPFTIDAIIDEPAHVAIESNFALTWQ